jgi:hypothetical protein
MEKLWQIGLPVAERKTIHFEPIGNLKLPANGLFLIA